MSLVKSLFFAVAAFGCMASPAYAAGAQRVMTYDVFAGGIHALQATLTMDETATGYKVNLSSATYGFLGKVAPWAGQFATDGKRTAKGDAFPVTHTSSSTWKKSTEVKTFTYDGKGNFVGYKVKEKDTDKTPTDLDKALTDGTTDILSATFAMMRNITPDKGCKSDDVIFDGDRNFHLLFENKASENLTKSDYNIYNGAAVSCTVEVKPGLGKWKKKPRGWLSIQEQGRQLGAGLPVIWFGQVDAGADAPYVPVKIMVKTSYGTLLMHLTSYKKN